jgi:hypothetical protein
MLECFENKYNLYMLYLFMENTVLENLLNLHAKKKKKTTIVNVKFGKEEICWLDLGVHCLNCFKKWARHLFGNQF